MGKDAAAECMGVSKTTLKKAQLALGMGEEPGAPALAAASPATSPPPSPKGSLCEPVAEVEADEPAAKRQRGDGDAVSIPPVPTRGDLQFGCACLAFACP